MRSPRRYTIAFAFFGAVVLTWVAMMMSFFLVTVVGAGAGAAEPARTLPHDTHVATPLPDNLLRFPHTLQRQLAGACAAPLAGVGVAAAGAAAGAGAGCGAGAGTGAGADCSPGSVVAGAGAGCGAGAGALLAAGAVVGVAGAEAAATCAATTAQTAAKAMTAAGPAPAASV